MRRGDVMGILAGGMESKHSTDVREHGSCHDTIVVIVFVFVGERGVWRRGVFIDLGTRSELGTCQSRILYAGKGLSRN